MPPSAAPTQAQGYWTEYAQWWSPAFADSLETVPALLWPESIKTYGAMRFDPQLTAVLTAYSLPLRQAGLWAIDPAGCRDEVVQQTADDLELPILGTDPKPSGARRRGVRWNEHLRLALLSLVFGHMPFAQQYKIVGTGSNQRARLIGLFERMPSTITQILTDDKGLLQSIIQFGDDSEISVNDLVWYVHEREGALWQGRSMLRPAYGPWLLKHEVMRVHATSIRRFGMGVPGFEAKTGTNVTPAQLAAANQLATQIRAGDQAGYAAPPGFELVLKGLSGSVPDAMGFLNFCNQEMSRMALAQVLDLGSTETGSRALGLTFVDILQASVNAVGQEIAETATDLAVQMVDYNWGEDEPVPRVVCADVASKPEATAQAISQLMTVTALTPDPNLEKWIRTRYALPERDPNTPPPQTALPTPPAPQAPSAPTAPQPPQPPKAPPAPQPPKPPGSGGGSTTPTPNRGSGTPVQASTPIDVESIVDALRGAGYEIVQASKGDPNPTGKNQFGPPWPKIHLPGKKKASGSTKPMLASEPLNNAEKAVLFEYLSAEGNHRFNHDLRYGTTPSYELEPGGGIYELDSAIGKSQVETAGVTYRGAIWKPGSPELAVGMTFKDLAYSSTSTNLSVAQDFAAFRHTGSSEKIGNGGTVPPIAGTPVVFAISLPKGQHALPGDVSASELILPRGTSYRVTGIRSDGVVEVDAE